MKNSKLEIKKLRLLLCVLHLAFCISLISAQSTNVDFPTPVTSNEISGKIRARDIGDSRLTAFYYVFNGNQGDVFINVEAENFNGDIDIFAADGLRPLSKIRMFSDSGVNETGRIVYLRQPEKLILKIEGRTPDDNPAAFRIKFAGSFVAYEGGAKTNEPELPEVKTDENSTVKVNSVGTIIENKKEEKTDDKNKIAENNSTEKTSKENKIVENKVATEAQPPKVVISENSTSENKSASDNEENKDKSVKPNPKTSAKRKIPVKKPVKPVKTGQVEEVKTEPPANSLENVRLIVLMKNGDKFEYSMTDVFRFSLNNNVLTVILKDGKIERRSIFDIQKFSVE